jgi:hypothetical protein
MLEIYVPGLRQILFLNSRFKLLYVVLVVPFLTYFFYVQKCISVFVVPFLKVRLSLFRPNFVLSRANTVLCDTSKYSLTRHSITLQFSLNYLRFNLPVNMNAIISTLTNGFLTEMIFFP